MVTSFFGASRHHLRRRLALAALALLACSAVFHAAAARAERSVDGEEELLPIYETEAERAARPLEPAFPLVSDPPPTGPIRNVAEYEPCTGALIRYPLGLPYTLIRDMTANVLVHVVVANDTVRAAAATSFVANGVDTSRVRWVVAPNNSIWTRDYGPWFVFDGNGDQVIMDHHYNRPSRPDDDRIPIVVAGLWGLPVVTHDLWHTGGNYMTEGHGLSFSTDLVWNENPSRTHADIAAFMSSYYGVDDYQVVPDISPSGIHHIDTWGKLLDEETVLVKQVAPTHVDYARIEANAAAIAAITDKYGRPFRVARVFCPTITSGNVASYTNSIILNNRVYVPTFNKPAEDAAALQVYRDNMPGYEVLGYAYSGWLTDDALHCRVLGVADRYMLRVDHAPIRTAMAARAIPVSVFADDRSETGLNMATSALHWRVVGSPTYATVPLAADAQPDWYVANIPAQAAGADVEYYVSVSDLGGRTASRPRPAPLANYRFHVEPATGVPPQGGTVAVLDFAASPTPFHAATTVRFALPAPAHVRLAIYDTTGRLVVRLADREFPAGAESLEWTGRDESGVRAASGIYLLSLETGGERLTRRVVFLR